MSSQLKVLASSPGEATIILVGKAQYYGEILTIAFPQFSAIPSQKVLQQSVNGEDLLLVIDGDSLGDILEPDSPYQIKIPELEIISTVIWPEIIGKRGTSKGVIGTAETSLEKKHFVAEKKINFKDEMENQTTSLQSSLVEENKQEYNEEIIDEKEEEVPLVAEHSKKHQSSMPVILISIIGVCVLLAGGAIAYIKLRPHQEPVKEQVVAKENIKKEAPKTSENQKLTPPSPPKPEPFTENIQKMSVPDVINKAPNTAVITREGERRLEVKQYDDGVLLLENAAVKGDAAAMLKLGLLYSPVDFKIGGAIPSPDMREAAKYLKKAEDGGMKDATVPRADLKEWLTKKAESGDEIARLTLKDFWK